MLEFMLWVFDFLVTARPMQSFVYYCSDCSSFIDLTKLEQGQLSLVASIEASVQGFQEFTGNHQWSSATLECDLSTYWSIFNHKIFTNWSSQNQFECQSSHVCHRCPSHQLAFWIGFFFFVAILWRKSLLANDVIGDFSILVILKSWIRRSSGVLQVTRVANADACDLGRRGLIGYHLWSSALLSAFLIEWTHRCLYFRYHSPGIWDEEHLSSLKAGEISLYYPKSAHGETAKDLAACWRSSRETCACESVSLLADAFDWRRYSSYNCDHSSIQLY